MLLLKVCLILGTIKASCSTEQLPGVVTRLLDKLSSGQELTASSKFALLLGEFLIKQKLRYVAPRRDERQIYYHLVHKMEYIENHTPLMRNVSVMERQILANAFQRDVLLMSPELKYGSLNANAEYEQLALNYDHLVNVGGPNSTLSDYCMRDIVELRFNKCKLKVDCLQMLTSEAPTYGYQRTHQVLLLYMLQHHKCAPHLSAPEIFELLATNYCTEVEREQNAIRSLGLTKQYRDLYLEQATICGLFGYNEFLNWRNVMEIGSWMNDDLNDTSQHINDLALVFHINAMLLLH